MDNTPNKRYLPSLSVGLQIVLEATLILTDDAAASSLLGGERLEDAAELPGPDSSTRQGSFSPHDGQNLKPGCNFVPHWGQKWKGILQK